MSHYLFHDRKDAGQQLARKLMHLANAKPLVLALPRGGVPVGIEIAKALKAALDLLLVRKIGVPWHPELAAGAVIDGERPHTVLNEEVIRMAGVTESDIAKSAKAGIAEIERRRQLWSRGRPHIPVTGHCAIVVDDGIATGASAKVALEAVRDQGASRVVVAMPVAPPDSAKALRAACDEAVFLATPEDFVSVGGYYGDFHQLDDNEVRQLLEHAAA